MVKIWGFPCHGLGSVTGRETLLGRAKKYTHTHTHTYKIICCGMWDLFLKKKFHIILFIFGCAGSLSLLGLFCSCSVWASHCSGFSCCSSWVLEHRLNSGGTQGQLLLGMWGLPRSGIKPVSPALALVGRFFSIEPPGKPSVWHL